VWYRGGASLAKTLRHKRHQKDAGRVGDECYRYELPQSNVRKTHHDEPDLVGQGGRDDERAKDGTKPPQWAHGYCLPQSDKPRVQRGSEDVFDEFTSHEAKDK